MIFAEFITTLATALTIFNVYSSSSVSAPSGMSGGGGGMISLRTARRWRQRTMTSSARIYFTMAIPYVAATVLVNRIATEEVVPIYIAAVASVSGRFNKGRHTVTEWIFKTLRTFTVLITIGLFMLFVGLEREARLATDNLYDINIGAKHVFLCMFSSYRWCAIAIVGMINAPPEQKKTNIALGVAKVSLIWLLLEGTGQSVAPDAWGIFDAVILTSTPLRNTVYVLYSVLVIFDTIESVSVAIASDRASLGALRKERSDTSTGEEDDPEFEGLGVLRRDAVEVMTFDEVYDHVRSETGKLFRNFLPSATELYNNHPASRDDGHPSPEEYADVEAGVPRGLQTSGLPAG